MIVRFKPTGQTGEIPDNEFDPNIYEQVGQQQTQQVTPNTTIQENSQNIPKTRTGNTLNEHAAALQRAKMAGDTAAVKSITDNYDRELEYQKDLSSGVLDTPEQKIKKTADAEKEKLNLKAGQYKNEVVETAKKLQKIVSEKSNYSPEQYKSLVDSYTSTLTTQQKKAAEFGASLTGNELAILAGQIPVRQEIGPSAGSWVKQMLTGEKPVQTGRVVDSDEEINRKLSILIPQLQGKEVGPQNFGKGSQSSTGGSILDRLLNYGKETASNIEPDTKNILNSILGAPRGIYDTVQNRAKQGMQTSPLDLLGEMGVGYVKSLNEDIGRPLEGGDIIGRAQENLKQRPVSTALDVLPFLGLLGKGKAATSIKDVGGATKTLKNAGILPKTGEVLKNVAEGSNEFITGGGTKELIARGVNLDEAKSLSKTLLDNGITGKLTDKGKIVQTQKALTDVGQGLQKTYKDSGATWKSSDITNNLKSVLEKEYGNAPNIMKAINQTISTISQKGKYILENNENLLNATDMWELKKAGDEFGKSAYNIPETGPLIKDMSKKITSTLREELSKKVPESVPKLRDYGNLKTYMDDVLTDPKGLQSSGGFWSTLNKALTGGIKGGSDIINQNLYNLGEKISPSTGGQASPLQKAVSSLSKPGAPSPEGMKYIQHVLEEAKKAGPVVPIKSKTILRDMRYKQGNFQPKGVK